MLDFLSMTAESTCVPTQTMVELVGQMLMMHLRIKQKKLRLIGKVMAKPDNNLCKRPLKSGVEECKTY